MKLQGRYFKPFLVKYPLFPIKKGIVTDEEVRKKIPSSSEKIEVVRSEKKEIEEIRPPEGSVKKEEEEVVLTGDERNFLIDIGKNPVSGVVSRYIRLGFNRYKGNKIQKELIDKELIGWKPVSTRKGRLKVLVLTDSGKSAISEVKIDKIFDKKGSFEHEYAKFRVGEYYRRKGYWVTI